MMPLTVGALLIGSLIAVSTYAQAAPLLAGCPIFPADNVWNTPIDHLSVDSNSSAYINTIGSTKTVHPDFGAAVWDGGRN